MSRPTESFAFTVDELRKAFELIDVSSSIYDNEATRQRALNELNLLGETSFWVSETLTTFLNFVIPDGVVAIRNHPLFRPLVCLIISELKNCMGEAGCDPSAQVVEAFKKIVTSDWVRIVHLRPSSRR